MHDYLSAYGQKDEQREKLIKRILIGALIAIVVGTAGYFYFRTWSEERAANAFIDKLRAKDYKAAYAMWGCTDATPCKYYSFEKFLEDWGPQGVYGDPVSAKVDDAEPCGDVVFVKVKFAKGDPPPLTVSNSNGVIGFAPWAECPGRHWRFKAFFKRIFGH